MTTSLLPGGVSVLGVDDPKGRHPDGYPLRFVQRHPHQAHG